MRTILKNRYYKRARAAIVLLSQPFCRLIAVLSVCKRAALVSSSLCFDLAKAALSQAESRPFFRTFASE